MNNIVFNHLSPNAALHNGSVDSQAIIQLWQNFYQNQLIRQDIQTLTADLPKQFFDKARSDWQQMGDRTDTALTDWLIALFNAVFNQPNLPQMPTILVRGGDEPEYFASQNGKPARIEFAHGYFASSLHEISHWCVAGKQRRMLNDFGYWYEADGRDESKQKLFEQVEIKPQAIECLLSLACDRYFYVSQDNLNADFDTSNSTFAADVFAKADEFLANPEQLPRDAKRLLWIFLHLCQEKYHAYS